MWRERLIRILLVGLAGVLVLGVAKGLAAWGEKQKVAGKTISLPTKQIGEKIEDVGEDVLGTVIKILPGANSFSSDPGSKEIPDPGSNLESETETKTETVKIIETQTKEIIEIIKELPEEQIEMIKKQVFREFCEQLLEE